ncbi:hypothetical protein BDZ94DRAFT_1311877 [Collybia nuda]|uniref:Uncharacterized protein n=1 Tax=Collybia nuda TaxID=64659 RepID=A0A9P6CGJ8_9AGAR|nr:hypothetical protein BDZ94DRAFT_1311877 [Collybia nuda]
MARFTVFLLALTLTLCQLFALAAPFGERRQIGGIKCNVSRLAIVSNLAASSKAVKNLATAAAGDPAAAAAAQTAQDGLTSSKQAIAVIAKGILTGQQSNADARTQTENGLTTAQSALANITSTDPAVTSAVTAAQTKVDATIADGAKVVANC